MPPTPKGGFKFADNEKLLCYHGPLLYEAKCVKTKKENGINLYFIHYQGWNKNWDEWVNETRILKINPDNLDKKEKLLNNHINAVKDKKKPGPKSGGPLVGSSPGTPGSSGAKDLKKGGGGSGNTSRASTPVSERSFKPHKRSLADDERSTSSREDDVAATPTRRSTSKRPRNSSDLALQQQHGPPKFKIPMPEELKYVLVSDWDLVTHKKSLFSLPAKHNVTSILNEYVKQQKNNSESSVSAVSEVMMGIKDFFDVAAGPELLYRLERRQYAVNVDEAKLKASDVYGSAHLLRLMVKMGPLLNRVGLDVHTEGNVHLIENIVGDFLLYLETNRSRLFTSKDYVEATEEYIASNQSD